MTHSHLDRDMLGMTESQKLNHTYWELAIAVGEYPIRPFSRAEVGVGVPDGIVADLNELLARAVELIEAGHKYEGLDH